MAGIGMQESHFLSHLVRVEDLEPKARNCTQVSKGFILFYTKKV
jgi:hypothetical protein